MALRRFSGRSHLAVWLFVVVCVLETGCAQQLVKLRADPYNPLSERLKLTARGGPKPSERTAQLLRRYDLVGLGHDSADQLARLTEIHRRRPQHEICYALAELSYITGSKAELTNRRRALGLFWQTVRYAYEYLFDPRYAEVRHAYDPQFRGACDLYNGGLESCLRMAQKVGLLTPGRTVEFEAGGKRRQIRIVAQNFRWSAEAFDRFEFVSDYDVEGLTNEYRTRGLGVPLIAVRRRGSARNQVEEKYYADGMSFPVTAFLRLEPSPDDGSEIERATLELYDPLSCTEVVVEGMQVPLESDLSTPLAYFLNNPAMRHLDTLGLFMPGKVEKISGLYMVQPYQPGKIPVLMVHGLWSSPMTWMEMFNDLRSRPEIRDRYQFWFYLYPTGKPFWKTAADLRKELAELQETFNPDGRQPALDEMVVVGHSMGGLIARLLTLEGGERYWAAVSETPLRQLSASDETKQRIRDVYYFQPNRSVRRVVTIGSPHRGSYFANRWTRWLARRLIVLPQETLDGTVELLKRNPGRFSRHDLAVSGTSIDSLSPKSPILQTMLETPQPPGVSYHNIVGVIEGSRLFKNSDGVVPYSSAHLDDVDSEIVVNVDHNHVHRHARSVMELQRILLEHAARRAQTAEWTPTRNINAYGER